jgi:hypothetical protein
MNTLAMVDLAGHLRVAPGLTRPNNLVSSRRDWASQLTRGIAVNDLPTRLGSIFSLCAHAHVLCARMAVAAARDLPLADAVLSASKLQQETLREHARRIALDWPRQLSAYDDGSRYSAPALATLQICPMKGAGPADPAQRANHSPALLRWLELHLLGLPAHEWLAQWQADPAAWLNHWCQDRKLWLPALLLQARAYASQTSPQSRLLRVQASEADLRALATSLSQQSGFSSQPLWRGACAETGPWTRLHEPQGAGINTPWLRLGARLAELIRLCLPDAQAHSGSLWLSSGSLRLDSGQGLAWIEMARGLLIHQVQLDSTQAEARVASCQVLAPTEWNFHPQGAVAQVLEAMPTHTTQRVYREADLLISAYDPCVRHEFVNNLPTAQPQGELHA